MNRWLSDYSVDDGISLGLLLSFGVGTLLIIEGYRTSVAALVGAVTLFVAVLVSFSVSGTRRVAVGRGLAHLLAFAFGLRLLAIPLVAGILSLSFGDPFLGDDAVYHAEATKVLHGWLSNGEYQIPKVLGNYEGYILLLAELYYLFGESIWIARGANAVMGTGIVYLTYRLADLLFGAQTAWKAGLFAAIHPNSIFFNALQYRDTTITLLTMVVLYVVVRGAVKRVNPIRDCVIVLPSIWLLNLFRYQVAFGLLYLTIGYALAIRADLDVPELLSNRTLRRRQVFALAGMGLVVAVVSVVASQYGGSLVGIFKIDSFSYYVQRRISAYGLPAPVEQQFTNVVVIPFLALMPLLLPLPTVVLGDYPVLTLVAMPGRLMWLALFPMFLYGIVYSVRERFVESLPLVGYVVGMSVGMFLMFEIFGLRKLITIAPVFLIFAAAGIHRAREYWYWNYVLYPGLLLLILSYNLFRLVYL